jgi:hypothetical protein
LLLLLLLLMLLPPLILLLRFSGAICSKHTVASAACSQLLSREPQTFIQIGDLLWGFSCLQPIGAGDVVASRLVVRYRSIISQSIPSSLSSITVVSTSQ